MGLRLLLFISMQDLVPNPPQPSPSLVVLLVTVSLAAGRPGPDCSSQVAGAGSKGDLGPVVPFNKRGLGRLLNAKWAPQNHLINAHGTV